MVARAGKARISAAQIENLMPRIQQRFLETIGEGDHKLEVWQVNGKVVRNEVFIDFTEGGNSEAYPWMGPNKIWLDRDVDAEEVRYVKLHELREYTLMHQGWDYEDAHRNANIYELETRDHPDRFERIWAEQVKLYNTVVRRKK